VLRAVGPPKGRQPIADKKNASLEELGSVFLVSSLLPVWYILDNLNYRKKK
jgi:hypothetical protein